MSRTNKRTKVENLYYKRKNKINKELKRCRNKDGLKHFENDKIKIELNIIHVNGTLKIVLKK